MGHKMVDMEEFFFLFLERKNINNYSQLLNYTSIGIYRNYTLQTHENKINQ